MCGWINRASPNTEICPFKAIQPAKQRDAGWNVEWACLKAYPRKYYDTRNKTSAGIGTTVEHPPRERIETKEIVTRGLTLRPTPTQSWSKQAKPKQPNQPSNAMRGGMWNGRASRRTQMNNAIQENKTSAGIGTTVKHPPRERIETASIERALKCVTAGGRSGPPLRRVRQHNQNQNQNQSNPTSQATRAH